MLDYKNVIIKRYAPILKYEELAEEFSASKSGINDFIRAFEMCEKLLYPLPEGITNYGILKRATKHHTTVIQPRNQLTIIGVSRHPLCSTQRPL